MKDFPSKCKTCANAIKTCGFGEEFESVVVVVDCKVSECKYTPCEILISTNLPGKELYMKTMRELADDEGERTT